MFVRRAFPWICPLLLGAAQCASGVGNRLTGSWGGDGIGVIVNGDTAHISYTCGETTVKGPISLDANQRFEATGEHIRVGGAAPRPDVPPERHVGHVAGQVRGDLLTLTVRLIDVDRDIGTFVLTKGATASILGCP